MHALWCDLFIQADMVEERQVSEAEALSWARQRNFMYFDVSAKSGQNISEMFKTVFNTVVQQVVK